MVSADLYKSLSQIVPWVCVDLEINPESDELLSAGILYKLEGHEPVSHTFQSHEWKKLFELLERIIKQDAVLIGHNLRRHDLPWLARNDLDFVSPKYCIDTLELFPIAYPSVRSFALDKDYQEKAWLDPKNDPLIGKKRKNHPALDCRGTMLLLESIYSVFQGIRDQDLLDAYRILLGFDGSFGAGYRRLLGDGSGTDPLTAFYNALDRLLCTTAFEKLKEQTVGESRARSLAYLLSLIPTDPDKSPKPPRPWVRYQHPEVLDLLTKLRGTDCGQCEYCKERFALLKQIDKLFRFEGEAKWRNDGQRIITESLMSGKSLIGVLPTSGGKSLTFQLPALINANNTGALTVVISPLRSLMDDQVTTLHEQHGRDDVCQVSGKLNSLERQKNLRAVRAEKSDDENAVPAHIVYMAPEQLRSPSVLRSLGARGIGLLVIDEAHCMAKWGKDFRVEYRFIPELIARLCREYKLPKPPVLCLTATARKEVLEEIKERFQHGLEVDLDIEDHGHARENLKFSCVTFPEGSDEEKFNRLLELVQPIYESGKASLIFCSTRNQTEQLCNKLRNGGFEEVAFYHGGCDREHREEVQNGFLSGNSRLIVATNAFGMGVDKKDIRLIVHYDVPGSLENYIQEAGRAGRDDEPSQCVLFYDPSDLDTQLDLRRRNQLRLNELKRIILTIRYRFNQAKKQGEEFPEIIISALDLMTSRIDLAGLIGQDEGEEGKDGSRNYIDEEEASIDQKVATALGILEESQHLERRENRYQFVSVPFRVEAWEKIEELIAKSSLPDPIKAVLRSLAEYLFDRTTSRDEKGSVDLEVVADQLGIERHQVKEHIDNLRGIGVCNWGNEYSIDWMRQSENSSIQRLDYHLGLIKFLITVVENSEATGDELEEINIDNIRKNSCAKDTKDRRDRIGYYDNRQVLLDLGKLAEWGLFTIDHRQRGKLWVSWSGQLNDAKERLEKLSRVTRIILEYFDKYQERKGKVVNKFNYDQFKRWYSSRQGLYKDECPEEADCEEALLYMHYRDVIDITDGFGILRARMKLIPSHERLFTNYIPAYSQYQVYAKSTVAQVKAMGRFAELLSKGTKQAEEYLDDYFTLDWDSFTKKHFTERERKNLTIPIRAEHFDKVFGSLTKEQLDAVNAKTNENHLILAGPGSGKTHVLVLRIFYLIKVRNVPPRSIAVLAYNRHAAIELRRRLKKLLPSDWYDIGVHTFHGLALRLIGRDRLHELQADSKEKNSKSDVFDQIISELAETLESYSGEDEREQVRWLDRLNGIEYLLVDEFQDIKWREYRIVKLLSRIESGSREGAVHVMAVGDEDQNIYEFRDRDDSKNSKNADGTQWILQFQKDFEIKDWITFTDNFRSVQGVIETASRFISKNKNRLKPEAWVQSIPNVVKRSRELLAEQDPDKGKVIRLKVRNPADARFAIAAEIEKVRGAFPEVKLGEICVAHHTNSEAQLTHKLFERIGVASQVLGEHQFAQRYQLGVIETIRELEALDPDKSNMSYNRLKALVRSKFTEIGIDESWMQSWGSFFDEDLLDISQDTEIPVKQMLWRIDEHLIGRAGNAVPQEKVACLTLHATKGLEFHTVFLFPHQFGNDMEELRRLYFVGLSRAKVKAFLIDWPDCNADLWYEMEELAGDWLKKRNPSPGYRAPSKDDEELTRSFRYFDMYKSGLGMGVNPFWPDNQKEIRALKKDQHLTWKSGVARSGNPKLEFFANDRCVGRLDKDALQALENEVAGNWDRIIGIEVAQIIQTETEEDKRKFNEGKEIHYFVVPRIFFK
ncbi:MAG: RecQ family ATP-dependent DNA helicase [bacterium]|nr:RecQ family ATP-dependent DNA helicase [bacterium]